MNSAIRRASSSDASNSIASAPAATPLMICDGETTKSFITIGSPAVFARWIHSRDPRKNSGSVTMEIAAAPPRA